LKPKEFTDSFRPVGGRLTAMMGERQVDQAALFYESLAIRRIDLD
jgi:hypothetical protein